MKKQLFVFFIAVITGVLMFFQHTTNATAFSFSGSTNGGEVSGTLNFDFTSNSDIITVGIINDSPTELMAGYFNTDGSNANAPGIVSFGFNVNPEILSTNTFDWSLRLDDATNISSYWDLTVDSGTGSVILDFFAGTATGVNGALYSSASNSDYWGANGFASPATLTIDFLNPLAGGSYAYDAFMKFQNVGVDGVGSVKSVPDASVMLLLGSSLLCLGVFSLKTKKS